MNSAQHAELPWHADPEDAVFDGMTSISSKDHQALAVVVTRMADFDPECVRDKLKREQLLANLALIITAVNYHTRLREALEEALSCMACGIPMMSPHESEVYDDARKLLSELETLP